MPTPPKHYFDIGELVQDDVGTVGTVRYVGPVITSKKQTTMWVGVEWHELGRGKHDGRVISKGPDGTEDTGVAKRYFSCSPGQGSFVKPSKLRGGRDFFVALVEKYQPDLQLETDFNADGSADDKEDVPESASAAEAKAEIALTYGNGEELAIEPVGMDRIRAKQQLQKLLEVSVPQSGITGLATKNEAHMRVHCPNIQELNMADNLIESWDAIGRIAQQLGYLKILDLSRNPLKALPCNPITPLPDSIRHGSAFHKLRVLVLVGAGTRVAQLQRVDNQALLPNLEELFLGHNGIASLDPNEDIKSDASSHKPRSYAQWAKAALVTEEDKGLSPTWFMSGFAKLRVLDLCDNVLTDWKEVYRACRLPKLELLNVAGNPLPSVTYFTEELQAVKTADQTLAEQAIKAEAAKALAKEQDNDASNVTAPKEETKERAKPLMMSNGLTIHVDDKVEPAKHSDARHFQGDGTRGGGFPFAALRTLNLARTLVDDWASVDALNQFPALAELRFKDAPLLDDINAGVARQNTIARVGKLTKMNGSEIRARERSDAERLYLKRVKLASIAEAKTGGTPDDTARDLEHPRYLELVVEHGEPMASKAGGAAGSGDGSLGADTASLTLRTFDAKTCTVPPAKKKLPLTMTVGALRLLCQRLFGVDSASQHLFYRETGKEFGHPVELDDDTSQLTFFGVQDGGEIIVETRDPRHAAALEEEERESKARKHAMREKAEMARLNQREEASRAAGLVQNLNLGN